MVVGALVVFGDRKTITLPIHEWRDGESKTLLCQGTTEDGLAPKYSASEDNLSRLLKQIKEDLESGGK